MKKFVVIALLTAAFSAFCVYSLGKKDEPVQSTVTGLVHIYGNEPHTFAGIVCDDGKAYTVRGEKEMVAEIRATQGEKISVTGVIIPAVTKDSEGRDILPFEQLKDGTIRASSWKKYTK